MTMLAWSLVFASLGAILYWGGAAALTWRSDRARVPVRRGLGTPAPDGGWPKVSVVVPVHDGEDVVDDCASMLRAQDYAGELEIIFVLDRCTDNTAERLSGHVRDDRRVVSVEISACPPAWAGKCQAAWVGAQHATGDWLLFTDADTAFDPALVRAAVGLAAARSVALLSVLSTLRFGHAWERVAQPVAVMHLMRLFPLDRVDRGVRSRPFANGQFLLFRRDLYDRIGGHEAVRHRLLEDIAFAQRVHRYGGRTAVATSEGMLRCAMYESFDAFRRGWKRILVEACGRKPGRLRKNSLRLLVFGSLMPIVQVLTLIVAASLISVDPIMAAGLAVAVVAALLFQVSALRRVYRLCGAPALALLGYPWGCWVIGRLVRQGADDLEQGRPLVWGGRAYVLEPRGHEWKFRSAEPARSRAG